MPLFEYRCRSCNEVSEHLMRGAANASIRCPACGGEDMERLLSATAAPRVDGTRDSRQTSCGRDSTCCGRAEPCATPPCGRD